MRRSPGSGGRALSSRPRHALTGSRRAFLFAARAKQLLDRLGIGRSRAVTRLADIARSRFFTDAPRGERLLRVRVRDFWLVVPEPLLPNYVHHDYEPLAVRWLEDSVRPGMRVVDVGANIGYFSLLMSSLVGRSGHVYAVEPGEENLEVLGAALDANGRDNVTVLPVAAGATRQERVLRLSDSSDSHSFYAHPLAETRATATVMETPLDDLIEAPVDLVKIDVEGAELEVLAGMSRLLAARPRPRLLVEWNPSCLRTAGERAEHLPSFLAERGFELSVLDEKAGRPRPVDEVLEALSSGTADPAWYGTLVAVPADAA